MEDRPAAVVRSFAIPRPDLESILLGIAAVIAATAVGALGLFGSRMSVPLRKKIRHTIDPFLEALQSIHSGHVGDYVAWLTAGVVALGAAFAITFRP